MRVMTMILCTALAAGAPATAAFKTPAAMPVMIGGEAELDACGTVGRVYRLKRDGDNFLSVRSAPSVAAPARARLRNGHLVWICDERPGWMGIVYDPDPAKQRAGSVPLDCGVANPVARRAVYRGPCRSGWVSAAFVEVIAG